MYYKRKTVQDCNDTPVPGTRPLGLKFTSSLKLLNRIQRNLTGSKRSMSFTKFVFFWPIGKTRWPPLPMIDLNIVDFSETAERNLLKLDKKQELNVIYQVCVFWVDRKTRWSSWPLIGWAILDYSSGSTEWNLMKLGKKQVLNILYQFPVFVPIEKNKDNCPGQFFKKGGILYSGAQYVALWASWFWYSFGRSCIIL